MHRYRTLRDLANDILNWHGSDFHLLNDMALYNWTDIMAYARELWHKRSVRNSSQLALHMPPH